MTTGDISTRTAAKGAAGKLPSDERGRPGAGLPVVVRRWCLIGYWAGIYVLTHWPDIDDLVIKPQWLFSGFDKIVHCGMYAGWAAVWWWVVRGRQGRVTRGTAGWILAGGMLYGVFDEVTQAIVEREPDVLDWLADVAGMATALLILGWWQGRRLKAGLAR